MAKVKKPIYKKWWFWVVVVVFGIGALGVGGNDDKSDDIPVLETVVETPSRAIETPDEQGQRLSDEAAAEDARQQQALAEIEEIPSETVQEITATQPEEQPTREVTPIVSTETPQAEPSERASQAEAVTAPQETADPVATAEPDPAPAVEPEPEPEPPKEPVKVSATVSGTSRTISLDSGSLVWLSETGKKFHSINNCGKMNPDKAYQVTIDYVHDHNLEACEKCW